MTATAGDVSDVINGDPKAKWRDMTEDVGSPGKAHWARTDATNDAARQRARSAVATGVHPAEMVQRWGTEGPLHRIPTGVAALDELCLGGLPVPWRMMIVGAPSAGKTFIEIIIANTLARAAEKSGLCVGILAVDEDPDDITIRLAQLAGFTIADAEKRSPAVLEAMKDALKPLRVRLYDARIGIESAAADLAAWAKAESRQAALFIDSLQSVTSDAAHDARSGRELVEANVKAMRLVSEQHAMLVVSTVEANRASYRDDDAVEKTNDMAAGAESRAIEFGAQTQIMLRTPKGHPDIVWVKVSKNRRGTKGEFFLKLDRETHTLSACEDPRNSPEATQAEAQRKRSAARAKIDQDARELLKVLVKTPGMGTKGLRNAAKFAGLTWGVERLDAATARLVEGIDGSRIVDRSPSSRGHCWHVESYPRADHA